MIIAVCMIRRKDVDNLNDNVDNFDDLGNLDDFFDCI